MYKRKEFSLKGTIFYLLGKKHDPRLGSWGIVRKIGIDFLFFNRVAKVRQGRTS